jgi:hypothetical protein
LGKSNLLFFLSLIILSCTEDPSTIGFKGPDSRFKVYYKEIDIPTSVIGTDSLITSNDLQLTNATKRLLVGTYTDDVFGVTKAETYTQFAPTKLAFPKGSIVESVNLNLTFDYYYYGDHTASVQTFYIHELRDSLVSHQPYYFNSKVDYYPLPLGQVTRDVIPQSFEDLMGLNTDSDTKNNVIDTLTVTLDKSFGERLLAYSIDDSMSYRDINKFKRAFKGFAIRSDGNEKIVGFNPTYSSTGLFKSRLVVYIQYPDKTTGTMKKSFVEYYFFFGSSTRGVTGFSKIEVSRAGSDLQVLDNQLHKEIYPANDLRYVQAGTPVFTKLDFSNFAKFTDTLSNMIINSAELVLDPVQPQEFPLPSNLGFKVLTEKNRFRKATSAIPSYYSGLIVADNDGELVVGERLSASELSKKFNLILSQNTDGTFKYNEFFTGFFQRLYYYRSDNNRFLKYGLISSSPGMGKSVNRLVFNKDKLKLKLYYTLPTTEKNQ